MVDREDTPMVDVVRVMLKNGLETGSFATPPHQVGVPFQQQGFDEQMHGNVNNDNA